MPVSDIIKKIPFSNYNVQRRIDEMAYDIESTLCDYLKTCQISLQLDESTIPDNQSLLLAYVQFIREEKICQEMLFAKKLITDTKGESVFRVLEDFFKEKENLLKNIIWVATDGTPAMVGRYRGFISYLKKAVPDVLAVHCVIHRHI